jgi:hypothetical protein
VVAHAAPFVFYGSAAVALISLRRRPREGHKDAPFRPGVAACSTVVAIALFYVIISNIRKLAYWIGYGDASLLARSLDGVFVRALLELVPWLGYVVAGLWIGWVFADGEVAGPCDWLERLGRVLGVVWLVLLFSPPLRPAF